MKMTKNYTYLLNITKNCKRADVNRKIYLRAARKGPSKTTKFTKMTKNGYLSKITKNRKRADENRKFI